jgi:hypothetical protein
MSEGKKYVDGVKELLSVDAIRELEAWWVECSIRHDREMMEEFAKHDSWKSYEDHKGR